jgi:hypothetical protein
MADLIFNAFKNIANGSIDLDSDTIKVMIVTASYIPDQDAYTKRLDITREVGRNRWAKVEVPRSSDRCGRVPCG